MSNSFSHPTMHSHSRASHDYHACHIHHAALIGGDSHVSILAPSGAPGVLDDDELLPGWICAVADSDSGVVRNITAVLGDDSALVVSEDRRRDREADGYDVKRQSVLENLGATNVPVPSDKALVNAPVERLAIPLLARVRVPFRLNNTFSILHQPCVNRGDSTSITSKV